MNTEPPVVRHFLVCGRVEYDPHAPLAPYSVRNVVFRHRPPAGAAYPIVAPELWVFVHLDGAGNHEVWIEVVRAPDTDTDTELVAAYGPFVVRFGPQRVGLSRGWHLVGVPFPRPGWYDFRLLNDGVVLAEEPILLEDE